METRFVNIVDKTEAISDEVRKLLNLTEDAYTELKYELSYAWMNGKNYQCVGALLAVSAIFHKWWAQAVIWREYEMLYTLRALKSVSRRREMYVDYLTTIRIYPPSVIYNNIVNQGLEIVTNNPKLEKIRL